MADEVKDYYIIEDDETYFECVSQMEKLDRNINLAYSIIEKTSDTQQIADLQDWVNRMKLKRLGLFNLTTIYDTNKAKKQDIITHTVRFGQTLKLLSNAYYGKSEFWQYIYVYNNLTTDLLTVGQVLQIPKVHPEKNLVFAKDLIDNLESNK